MANLRILQLSVIDSTIISVRFNDNLDPNIGVNNISISPQTPSVPEPLVLATKIIGPMITITCQPLTPFVAYFINFNSTSTVPFKSVNGLSILPQDGVSNQEFIIGPTEPGNSVYEFLVNYVNPRDNIYNVSDQTTLINKYIQALTLICSKALYDIRQVKNENYLSFLVTDEKHVRGAGPFDRLGEEAAYEILRVGLTQTSAPSTLKLNIDDFTNSNVTLLSTSAIEVLTPSSSDTQEHFNITDLVLTVNNNPVTKLKSVIFSFDDGYLPFTYDIETLGYQILDSKYDKQFGFTYLLLNNNQFKLNAAILTNSNFHIHNIVQIQVSYEYKDLGRIVDSTTAQIWDIFTSSREPTPPIVNVFNLKHAPITDALGNLETLEGVIFIDPNGLGSNALHPAFLYELPFSFGTPPSKPGEYSIDYTSGTVYVYGADTTNNGTGPTPPLATYNYKFFYQELIDYAYDIDANDIVALPNGNLINNAASITFNYEKVLVPGVDYNTNLHIESLNERIQNRLLALNILTTKNYPVTNVFRIYNETTGEIYNPVRWNNEKIYFSYINPPDIKSLTSERASFTDVLNELLFIDTTLINVGLINIFRCPLQNNTIISGTEDTIASSINTSATFSNSQIFIQEMWYDANESVSNNINRINSIGQYMIDYANGIIYVGVIDPTNIDIGTISYKNDNIVPHFPHIISVDDIYYRISFFNPKDKQFAYNRFSDGIIVPSSFDVSDEAFLAGNTGEPYQIHDGYLIGAFVDAVFEPVVSNNIKYIRSIYEFNDLKFNIHPLNFGPSATFSSRTITVNPVNGNLLTTVQHNNTDGYYVLTNLDLPYISPNFTFTITVTRLSDTMSLWNGTGTLSAGNPLKLILPNINNPQVGDAVSVTYSIIINDLSRVIVDYNKGEYYIDYTYLADEILVSYEYGDNVIDFRQSQSVPEGTTYYASYRVGALRDALLKNFGTLVNIPELAVFDTALERERYRDLLSAALSSFLQGPTVSAMKNLVAQVSHIEPELIESAFQNWSLGNSVLNPLGIQTTGEFSLIPSKYDNGVLINTSGQTITFPVSSNLRLENGSFECWVMPEWNGLDNDANLTFSVFKDGYNDGYIIPSDKIFIGASEYHPVYIDNLFTINKSTNVIGTPNKNKDGVYIYYDKDPSNTFYRWYCEVVDGYSDGYFDGYSTFYNINILSDGVFYDLKSIPSLSSQNMTIRSGTNKISFTIGNGVPIDQGITFVSDFNHYILDFGEKENKNRLSIFKDPSGYINLKIYDRRNMAYIVSANISSWAINELHHIAASWALNTPNNRDELHLFIDGVEVPNIIRYGTKVHPYLHEKYRTINPEEIAGIITKNIVGSIDLATTAGSAVVSSSINFTAYGISNGDTIFIDEVGFNSNGYTINIVSGNSLTLATTMPLSITNGNFSVNRQSLNVITEIDIYPNIAVSTISSILDGYDGYATSGDNKIYSVATNFALAGVVPGDLVRIDNVLFASHYTILNVSGDALTINDTVPSTISGATFHIYKNDPIEIPGVRALRPSYSISELPIDGYVNYILTLSNNVKANDLILINTLGINHKRTRQTYYQWATTDGYSTPSDGYSNILMTRLPAPVSLNSVLINHILLGATNIYSTGDGYNATIGGGGILTSFQLSTDQPSISDKGRTLAVIITSTNNIDFSTPVTVMINGYNGTSTITETITFSSSSELGIAKNTTNKFISVNYVQVSGKPINTNKKFIVLTVKEAYAITTPENSTVYPVIRFSYPILAGTTLAGSGSTITDTSRLFSSLDVGNYIVISSPPPAAGTFQIVAVSTDFHSATISASLPSFTSGIYQVLNATTYRSGLQNGFFVLEQANLPGTPYYLRRGLYSLDYYSYLSIRVEPFYNKAYLGTDINGENLLNGILSDVKIIGSKLTDTRIGEIALATHETITKDFNSLKPLQADKNTLLLAPLSSFPFTNDASFYTRSETKDFIQSGISVNNNFNQSVIINDKPIIIENSGILNKNEGTIEFWISPAFDTQNNPNYEFYFDASATEIENVISINDVSVMVSGRVGKVISVKLQDGDPNIDYFAGGKVEINTQGAAQETAISTSSNTVVASKQILQVITVKIANDPTNTDYFAGGVVGTDKKTIYLAKNLPQSNLELVITYKPASGGDQQLNSQIIRLNRQLPKQQTAVTVTYVPSGAQGDRISIYKDPYGYINFDVNASGIDYIVRAQASWPSNSWHRIKATYSLNGGQNNDTIRLFMDGYERGNILFGSGLLFGDPHVFGSFFIGQSTLKTNIVFKDTINELFIGTDFTKSNGAFSTIDNLRISNIARPVFAPFGESIDVNYNSNTSAAFPVTSDLFTTLLLDFDTLITLNTSFATLKNKNGGNFDFTLNIFDSFDILKDSTRVKGILETLINVLKPATSRAFINYIG